MTFINYKTHESPKIIHTITCTKKPQILLPDGLKANPAIKEENATPDKTQQRRIRQQP